MLCHSAMPWFPPTPPFLCCPPISIALPLLYALIPTVLPLLYCALTPIILPLLYYALILTALPFLNMLWPPLLCRSFTIPWASLLCHSFTVLQSPLFCHSSISLPLFFYGTVPTALSLLQYAPIPAALPLLYCFWNQAVLLLHCFSMVPTTLQFLYYALNFNDPSLFYWYNPHFSATFWYNLYSNLHTSLCPHFRGKYTTFSHPLPHFSLFIRHLCTAVLRLAFYCLDYFIAFATLLHFFYMHSFQYSQCISA